MMDTMTTLNVISENTGAPVGTIGRAADGTIEATGIGQDIFDQIQNGKGWDSAETFEALADGGWSNGYITVQAASKED